MAENQEVIKSKWFDTDNATAAGFAEDVKNFVSENELKHEQIIKIAMMQSGSGNKTALRCVLLYKESSA